MRSFLLVPIFLSMTGCATLQTLSTYRTPPPPQAPPWSPPPSSAPVAVSAPPGYQTAVKLMIFGGPGHKTYLGCLTCSPEALDSIFNSAGPNGHCGPFDDNLWCRNAFAQFGNKGVFAEHSACSDYATDPPVIVDHEGRYYGRFSISDGGFGHADSVCRSVFGSHGNEAACKVVKVVCAED